MRAPGLPSIMDSTMMSAFRQCPRKFFDEYCLELGPPGAKSVHLHAGGVFAATIEAFYRGIWEHDLEPDKALARAMGVFLDEWGEFDNVPETSGKTKEGTWDAVQDYVKTYPPHIDHVQPLFQEGHATFEYTFAIPLLDPIFPVHPVTGDPFVYGGRFDMLGRLVGPETVCTRDEKLQGRLMSNWSEAWDLRSQFLGYNWAVQQSGLKCNTTVVRGIILTKTMIRHVEAIKIYPQYMIERWYKQLARDLHRMVACWKEGYFDYNLGEACTAFGSNCMFMPLCTSNQPEAWYSNYSHRKWNPLAKGNESD